MKDEKVLCRLVFADTNGTYDRTQLLDPVAVDLIEARLGNGSYSIKLDLGYGFEYIVHITRLTEIHP